VIPFVRDVAVIWFKGEQMKAQHLKFMSAYSLPGLSPRRPIASVMEYAFSADMVLQRRPKWGQRNRKRLRKSRQAARLANEKR
jgi:hypothetical protein